MDWIFIIEVGVLTVWPLSREPPTDYLFLKRPANVDGTAFKMSPIVFTVHTYFAFTVFLAEVDKLAVSAFWHLLSVPKAKVIIIVRA